MNKPTALGLLGLLCILTNCTRYVTIDGSCGSQPTDAAVCLGSMRVPDNRREKFVVASRQAIDAIYSPAFEPALALYIQHIPAAHQQDPDWQGVTAAQVTRDLRGRVAGLQIHTYGGPWNFFIHYSWIGNIAKEGSGNTVRINRWGLQARDTEQIANSIAHEAAHRVGLHHYGEQRDCEPPYVIERIVEKIARGQPWQESDCQCYQ